MLELLQFNLHWLGHCGLQGHLHCAISTSSSGMVAIADPANHHSSDSEETVPAKAAQQHCGTLYLGRLAMVTRTRRRMYLFISFIAGGVATNALVAWSLERYWYRLPLTIYSQDRTFVEYPSVSGVLTVYARSGFQRALNNGPREMSKTVYPVEHIVPSWSAVRIPGSLPYDLEEAVGWPMLCFVSYVSAASDPLASLPSMPRARVTGSLTAPPNPWNVPDSGLFAYRPLFPGIIVNSIFWSAIIAAFSYSTHYSIRAARRLIAAHRSRRGLCTHCGYARGSMRTARCPECGNNVD